MLNAKIRGSQEHPAITQNYETIVLKPRIVNDVNVISQQDIAGDNKKFVIKWGFTLTENLVFGTGCILDFDGGFFTNDEAHNYTITGNNTRVILNIDEAACLKGVYKGGTWLYPEFPLSPDEFTREDDQIVIADESIAPNNLKQKAATHEKIGDEAIKRRNISTDPEDSIADNEDLTVSNTGQLKLANKAYAPEEFSGLGRVYLRKNIVQRPNVSSGSWMTYVAGGLTYLLYWYEGVLYNCHKADNYGLVVVNHIAVETAEYDVEALPDYAQENSLTYTESGGLITITLPDGTTITASSIYDVTLYPYEDNVDDINMLMQDMMPQEKTDTIYIIQYDYTLGEDITIPENCVLEFEGGSIDGQDSYSLTLTNTLLTGEIKCFCDLLGSCINSSFDVSCFTKTADITSVFERLFHFGIPLFIPKGIWEITRTVSIPTNGAILGDNSITSIIKLKAQSYIRNSAGATNILIQSVQLVLDANNNSYALELGMTRWCNFKDIKITSDSEVATTNGGIKLKVEEGVAYGGITGVTFRDVNISNVKIGILCDTETNNEGTTDYVTDCTFDSIRIWNFYDTAIKLKGYRVSTSRFINCEIDDTFRTETSQRRGIDFDGCYGNVISNICMWDDASAHNNTVFHALYFSRAPQTTSVQNDITGYIEGSLGGYEGLEYDMMYYNYDFKIVTRNSFRGEVSNYNIAHSHFVNLFDRNVYFTDDKAVPLQDDTTTLKFPFNGEAIIKNNIASKLGVQFEFDKKVLRSGYKYWIFTRFTTEASWAEIRLYINGSSALYKAADRNEFVDYKPLVIQTTDTTLEGLSELSMNGNASRTMTIKQLYIVPFLDTDPVWMLKDEKLLKLLNVVTI